MSLDNLLVTTPYVTHSKLQLVIDKMEDEWKEWEDDPSFMFTVVKLNNENFIPGTVKNIPGLYNTVVNSTKPIVIKDYKVNGEEAPVIFSVAEKTSYYDQGTIHNAVKLQSSFGMFYIYESNNVIWITRWVKASDYIKEIQTNTNYGRETSETVSMLETIMLWKDDLSSELKLLFTDLTISAIWKDGNESTGAFNQYSTTAHTITTTGIYFHTFDEPAIGFRDVSKFHLYAGLLSSI